MKQGGGIREVLPGKNYYSSRPWRETLGEHEYYSCVRQLPRITPGVRTFPATNLVPVPFTLRELCLSR